MSTLTALSYTELQKILPQAYPFLLIDRVTEIKEGESLIAIKNITSNEWPFEGTDNDPLFYPETLLIEAAAQAALVLYHVSKVKDGASPRFILGKSKVEFYEPIFVGDQMYLYVTAGKMLGKSGYANIEVKVDVQKRADVQIYYGVQEKESN